jgi:ribosome-binding factor A
MVFGVRKDRLNQQLQREIATVIQRELIDTRRGFVTITKVELSNDLTHAKVAFSCLGGMQERMRSQEALDHAAGFIRSLVKKRLRLKIIPEIVFRYDETIALAIELSTKLDQLKSS